MSAVRYSRWRSMPPADVHQRTTAPLPPWLRWIWDTPWVWMALVIVFFCAPLFVGLDGTDFENDEAIYSFAVDVMLADGDWLTPKSIPSETSPFLEKPPLKLWITALPIRLGLLPADEFGMRFMDVLLGSLGFLYVLAIGRRLAGPVCGVVAVLLLFTNTPLLFEHGLRTNNMESAVFLAYCAGVYHFLAWRSVNPDVKRHVYGMALAFVLGFMTKFVAALFLPVILALAALSTHEDRARLYRDWRTFLLAALLTVALIAPWFVYQYLRDPQVFDVMFGEHIVKRFTVYLDPEHLHPWHFYVTVLWDQLKSSGTAILTVAGALLLTARALRRRWVEGALVVLWFALPIAAISTGTSKLYHYAYPFMPPVALAGGYAIAFAAKWLDRWLARPFDAFGGARSRLWPRALGAAPLQTGATTVGLAALVIALATAVFDRLQIAMGPVVLRNSSVLRPAVAGLIALVIGAPARVLCGLAAAAIVAVALPLDIVQASVTRTRTASTPVRDVRDCVTPIVADLVSRGGELPGVWVEIGPVTRVPAYYLHALGPWQQRYVPSDDTVAMHLLAPNAFKPVILTDERYVEMREWLLADRPRAIARVARKSGLDPAEIEASLQQSVVGIVRLSRETLLLPGPYKSCAHRHIHLLYR